MIYKALLGIGFRGDLLSTNTRKPAAAVRKAAIAMSKYHFWRLAQSKVKTCNGPDTTGVHNMLSDFTL